MPTRNARPTIFRAKTLSDAVDATNGPPGAMALLQNLIPAVFNREIMVPRPAAIQLTTFSPGFTLPATVELQFVVGNLIYGWVQTARFSGLSEPYIYNQQTKQFLPIQGVTAAKCPVQTSNTGDWTPPDADQIGSRVVMTHPGYTGGGGIVMGWFDQTGINSSALSGNTNSNTLLTGLSFNPLQAGFSPGMLISSSAGDIPPGTWIVALTASTITLSAAATGTHAGVTFTITGGTAASPLFAAGNTNGRALTSVPTNVVNFYGRAYYATGPKLDFSDAGNATQISDNPNVQTINYQNGVNINAISATPFTNVLGGIASALIVFQGTSFIQQVTGDPTTSNLSTQLITHGTGTFAPNSIDVAPNIGLLFISADGLRIINLQGVVSQALGTQGDGVALPFINAQFPTRMTGAWNVDTYRIAVETSTTPSTIWDQFTWGAALWGAGAIVTQEYWFNTKLNIWTGPHTFPSTLITANPVGSNFIVSSLSAGPGLWTSDAIGDAADSYTELGHLLTCSATTSLMPDNQAMAMNCLAGQSTAIGFASSGGMTANVTFTRENGQTLDTVTIPVAGQQEAIWGSFIWGSANWGAVASKFAQYGVYWNQTLTFKQGQIGVSFMAGPGNLLGNIYLRIEPLGYELLGLNDAL